MRTYGCDAAHNVDGLARTAAWWRRPDDRVPRYVLKLLIIAAGMKRVR